MEKTAVGINQPPAPRRSARREKGTGRLGAPVAASAEAIQPGIGRGRCDRRQIGERPGRVGFPRGVWFCRHTATVSAGAQRRRRQERAACEPSRKTACFHVAKKRMKNWQKRAPTTVIDKPQSRCGRNSTRSSSPSGRAPTAAPRWIESGDTTTIAAPTLMLRATCRASPPPSFSMKPGTAGRNAG